MGTEKFRKNLIGVSDCVDIDSVQTAIKPDLRRDIQSSR